MLSARSEYSGVKFLKLKSYDNVNNLCMWLVSCEDCC